MIKKGALVIGLLLIFVISALVGWVFGDKYQKFNFNRTENKALRQAYLEEFEVESLNAYFYGLRNDRLTLQVMNVSRLPMEVLGAEIEGVQYAITPTILQSKGDEQFKYHTLVFTSDTPHTPGSYTNSIKLFYRTVKTTEERTVIAYPWPYRHAKILENDIMLAPSNVRNFSMFSINEKTKQIKIKPGIWRIYNTIKIPEGYSVIAKSGTVIRLENGANIISYSPLQWQGSKNSPVVIESLTKKGQGIVVLNTKEASSLTYVVFKNLSNPKKSHWELTGALTFYESDVVMRHCRFENNQEGDDYLNVFRAKVELENCKFENVNSDAFDGDFVTGIIKNTEFRNIGNDGIDISGSDIDVHAVNIINAGDKALSAGERSVMRIEDVRIIGGQIGVTSKDDSEVLGQSITINGTKLGVVGFQKKPEYTGADIELEKLEFTDVETPYLLEKGSTLTLNTKKQKHTHKNVKKLLYGNEYGKSSK